MKKKKIFIGIIIFTIFTLSYSYAKKQISLYKLPEKVSHDDLYEIVKLQNKEIINLKSEINTLQFKFNNLGNSSPTVKIYDQVKDSIVTIFCKTRENPLFDTRSQGTGIIIDIKGFILTSYHVVEDAEHIEVKTSNGSSFVASIVSYYKYNDLALLKINPQAAAKNKGFWKIQAIKFGDYNKLSIGQQVIAIGNPFGVAENDSKPSLSVGVISALHKYVPVDKEMSYCDAIQTDAALNPGNSGGPLLDIQGNLIGINGLISSLSRTNSGVGFAIPVSIINKIIDKMKEGKIIRRGLTGFSFDNFESSETRKLNFPGVKLVRIAKNSPGEKLAKEHGIAVGSGLSMINNKHIRSIADLANALAYVTDGEKIKMIFVVDSQDRLSRNNFPKQVVIELTTVSQFTSSIDKEMERANKLIENKNLEEAYNLLTTIIDVDGKNATACYNMACVCSMLNKKKEAIMFLRMAAKAGLKDIKQIVNDIDLDNIKNEKDFKDLINEIENGTI